MPKSSTRIANSATVNNNTTVGGSSSKPLLFQQLYQIFTFIYKYIHSILFIKQQRQQTTATHNQIALQYYKGKTLVLDLDETLVHSVRLGTTESNVSASIKKKTIEVTSDKQSILYEVYKRPHVDFFLATVRKKSVKRPPRPFCMLKSIYTQ